MPAPWGRINPDWPLATFANGLRALKHESKLNYREMAEKAHYCREVLSAAARGQELPTLQVTLAYVRVCGGSEEEWCVQWATARNLYLSHREGDRRA